MQVTIWIDWDRQDLCKNETELRDAYDDSGSGLVFADFLGDYCIGKDWGEVWELFGNSSDRYAILKAFNDAEEKDFQEWVYDHYEELTLEV